MRALCLVLMLIPTVVVLTEGQDKQVLNIFPGDTVQVAVTGLNATDTITVNLKAVSEQPANPPVSPDSQLPATTNLCSSDVEPISVEGPSKNGFSFGIQPDICAGLYKLTASRQLTNNASANGQITETPDNNVNISSAQYLRVKEKLPVVTGISPKALFRDERAVLVFLGPSSLKADADYSVRFADLALPKCGKESTDPPQNGESCFQQEKRASDDGQIEFSLKGGRVQKEFSGKQSVSLVHSGAESSAQEVNFVDASRSTPRNYALGITAALVILIYLLLSAGHKVLQPKSGREAFLLTALVLDEETQTYSLSKCQFYARTLAAILGYVFFAVARSVVQGNATFPDIPGGLPAILLFSAGTSVVATGITSSKGSKGAGQVHPTLADFLTNGGVVAPERLQFVVWTVVGIFTFLTIVFKSDPLTLSDLPNIPSGFLQLMGISSAGYLAGKLVRKPGPVVKILSVANVTPVGVNLPNQYLPEGGTAVRPPVLTLNLKGENLDPKANIRVDGQPLRGDMFWIKGGTPDPKSGFCSELNVSLNDAAAYVEGTHTLTVVNNDAQAADVIFPIDAMTIDSVQVPAGAPAPQPDVVVIGKNFVTGTTAEWRDDTGGVVPNFNAVSFQSATSLAVDRPPGAQPGSSFTITLISPVQLKASKKL